MIFRRGGESRNLKREEGKKCLRGTASFPPESFSLSPLMLNRIELGRVRRKIFKEVTCLCYSLLNIGSLVKSGVIQDNNTLRGYLRQ